MQKQQLNTTDTSLPTIQGVKKQWDVLGENYSEGDACPQTFFYTLVSLLQLDKADNILQVACGSGKLLPMIVDIKKPTANYLATDISEKMLSILHQRLTAHLQKYESSLSVEEWMRKVNLEVHLANGQEQLQSQIKSQKFSQQSEPMKFDRIIANMVLMLTPDAQKMLCNLANHSKQGCLFGLSVWGEKKDNNFQTQFVQVANKLGFPQPPATRSNFYLYNQVDELAEKTGWSVVLKWDQIAIAPYIDGQGIRPYAKIATTRMDHLNGEQQKQLQDAIVDKMKETLNSGKVIQFSAQCYILRKN